MKTYQASRVAVAIAVCAGAVLMPSVASAASASIGALYPAADVPVGATVTFTVVTSGFTNPTFYLVDSFPGGATTVNLNSQGDFSWQPNQDEAGTHTLTITVSDTLGNNATVSQTITVAGSGSVSLGTPSPADSVGVGVPVSFSISSSGLFSPTYRVSDSFAGSSVQGSDLNPAGTLFTWTPLPQDIGTHTITVSAKDTYGNTANASIRITVLPSPEVVIKNLSPGTSVSVGQKLTFVASTTGFVSPSFSVSDAWGGAGTTSGVVIDSSGQASWTPPYNDVGVHPLLVSVSDSGGRSATAKVTITVGPASAASTPQEVTPYVAPTSTPVQTPQPTPQSAPSSAPVQTPAQVQTHSSAQAPAAPQGSAPQEAPFVQGQTAPLFTDQFVPRETPAATSAPQVPASLPPGPGSFGMFLIHSVVDIFASLFSWL